MICKVEVFESSREKADDCPLGLSAVVLRIIQSMATRKRIGQMTHPCCTPDSKENQIDRFSSTTTLHSNNS